MPESGETCAGRTTEEARPVGAANVSGVLQQLRAEPSLHEPLNLVSSIQSSTWACTRPSRKW